MSAPAGSLLPVSDDSNQFHYSELDYGQSSLRLLKVLPYLSEDGLVQCKVYAATVD